MLLQSAPTVWYKDPITLATGLSTIIIAGATVVYVITTIRLWRETRDNVQITREMLKITRETFEQSVKPIVAIPEVSPLNNSENRELNFIVKVENYGNIPAVEVKTSAEILADGIQLHVQKHETGFLLIVPHSHILTTLILAGDNYQRAISSASLVIRFSARYEGAAEKHYKYDFEGVYYPNRHEVVTTNTKSTDLGQQQ
ncbi:MAG TPA: hypothetical protein VFQ47_05045 [Nitrososphaera sp.]|nr:hypothetical protein [Nitrososphaera sp.]